MNRNFFLLSFGIGAMILAVDHAIAQPTCADHDTIVARLVEHFGERRQSVGLDQDNALVEIFASMETGSWTMTMTRPGGLTCLVAAGQGFQHLRDVLPDVESST